MGRRSRRLGHRGRSQPQRPLPSWQSDVVPDASNDKRRTPDVAGPADPDSGLFIVFNGKPSTVGGTSAAAPFWAGVAVLMRQLAEREKAGHLGFLNPILYQLASTKEHAQLFHDVTRGGNRLNNAGPGWDYATGLGSPDASNLAKAVVKQLQTIRSGK